MKPDNMNSRLRQIIDLKAHGRQAEFAAIMGWTPQYLSRLVLGDSGIGIRPIAAILTKFPDIDARWLILGQGAMLSSGVDKAKAHLLRLLSLEKYMPVMSSDELRQLTEDGNTDFPPDVIARWEEQLASRQDFITSAIDRSAKCNPPTAR